MRWFVLVLAILSAGCSVAYHAKRVPITPVCYISRNSFDDQTPVRRIAYLNYRGEVISIRRWEKGIRCGSTFIPFDGDDMIIDLGEFPTNPGGQ